ncbi:MAG: hypothetical protein KJ000_06730 [Pirellulaceae bacterium]|nr:hypothetical protein [Pirellulaceae bacterium]
MAKTRRIIRKLKLPVGHAFDDQLWPVILALCVLAGFAMGTILAYLRFDDPRWYANAALWLAVTLLATAGSAAALWKMDNRKFRRSMQLAIVLGLFLHAVFFVATLELNIFSRIYDNFLARNDLAENRRQVTVPNYVEVARPDERRPEFERPVEVELPEPQPEVEQVTRQEVEPEQRVQPQPTPVPEPENTPQPNVVRREQNEETSPRYSDQRSQLSRRVTDSRPTPPSSQASDVPTPPALSRTAEMQAQDSTPQRQQTAAELAGRQPAAEPATSQSRPDVQVARRADQQTPEIQDSATPTFQRQMQPSVAVPRTAVDLAEAPAVSAATNPNELRPHTTLAQRQNTASPQPSQTRAEPVPDTSTDVASSPQLRQSPTEARPDMARTPVAVPNQRTRTTPRPETATAASRMTPTATPAPPQPDARPLESPPTEVARTTLDRPVERRTVADDPSTQQPQTAVQVARRDLGQTPVPETPPSVTPTPRRTTPQPTVGASALAQVTRPAAVANEARQNELEPSATTPSRQATANDRIARSAATDARLQPAPAEATAVAAQAIRPPRAESAPDVAQSLRSLPSSRTQPVAQPRPDTIADNVGATASPSAESAASLQPAAASIARAAAQPNAARSQATAAEPAADVAAATSPTIQRVATETPVAQPASPTVAADAPARSATATSTTPATAAAQVAAPAAVAVASSGAADQPAARVATASRQTSPSGPVAQNAPAPSATVEATSSPAPQAAVARAVAQSAPSAVAPAASAPATTPRRAAQSPSPATEIAAQSPQAPAIASTADGSTASAPAASRIAVNRQTAPAPAPAVSGADAVAGVATPTPSTGPSAESPAATRSPRGSAAPEIAQSDVSSPARRQSTSALPSATTVQADVAANLSAAQAPSDQPRPSAATVARQQVAEPTATRSQQAAEVQAASTSTQVARAATPRIEQSTAPSVTPSADPTARPSRAALRSAVAASPTAVESPAVAAAERGAGEPVAAPVRMAMAKSMTGTAGVGGGRNLDRARPAADSPAMVASASARRAESIQDTPPGPDLSPAAPALVRRATAGQTAPGASLQAQPITELATAAGADRPTELAASASAAQRRADAKAAEGPTTAARGTTEVDLGATQVVSEGQSGRASGGGQPVLNFETDSPQLARSEQVGGAPLAALAEPTRVDVPTAPPSTGGGQPPTPETETTPTAVARTDPGGGQPISGGPSKSSETGPPTELSMTTRVAAASISRTELAESLPGSPAAGGGEDEDEEERRRRLARAASQQIAIATSTAADLAGPSGAADGGERPQVAAAAVSVARAEATQVAGASAGSAAAAGPGEAAAVQVSAAPTGRASAAEQTPDGPLVAATAAGAPQRAPGQSGAPATATGAETVELAAATGAAETGLAASSAAASRATGATGALAAAQMPAAFAESQTTGGIAAPVATSRATTAPQPALAAGRPAASPARSATNAALPTVALAAAQVSAGGEPAASGTTPGGEPMTAAATALARADTTGPQATTGGPAGSEVAVAAAQAEPIASAAIPRSTASEAAPGQAASGGGQPATDRAATVDRALARRPSGGAPQLALAGPSPADIARATGAQPAGGGADGSPLTALMAASPESATTARQTGGGSPASGQRGPISETGPTSSTSGGDLLAAAEFTRAEAVDAAAGPPDIGGGTQAPARAARGPLLTADLRADTLQIAGMPDSGGLPDGSPVAAQGIQAAKLAAGANAIPTSGPVGAAADPTSVDAAVAGATGVAIGSRSTSPSLADGPAVAAAAPGGLPFDRSGPDSLPFSAAAVSMVDVPALGGDEAFQQASADHSLRGLADDVSVSRQTTEGGLAVNVDAPAGPGGLGTEFAPDTGLNHRRAAADSLQVQVRTARFVRQQTGGRPDFSTAAIVATEPFQRRPGGSPGDGSAGGRGSPPPMTEEAIELGLAYLSRIQLEDGSWSLQGNGESAALVADTAATGLALLAFQGAGYNHREHKYAEVVNAAIQHLVKNQKPDGDLFLPLDDESNRSVWIYSHSIAALALSEAFGMTQDPALREPAQKALDFLMASQHPERGGWRYSPQTGSDTSVTGWAMMALKSGDLADLNVPEEAYNRIRRWLDKSQGSSNDPHLYSYNPYAPDTEEQRHGRRPSTTMTSVGLLMRLYLGWQRDNVNMVRGAEYLAQNLPKLGSARNPERDTYYWYYATQVMFHMGGDYWEAWNGKLHPLLVGHQIRQGPLAGSWDPRRPVPDRWAPHAGRLYVTTMNLLSLEVYYRHLPLYEDTAR